MILLYIHNNFVFINNLFNNHLIDYYYIIKFNHSKGHILLV